MKKNIKTLLEELGFMDKEAAVYMALLENGSCKASDLAKITGLNRVSTYDQLEALIKRGVVSKYKKESATFFSALDPARLLNYLDREKDELTQKIEKQKSEVQNLLPELKTMMNFARKTRPQVRFFEGEKGMREAYEDTLTSSEPIRAFANIKTMREGLPGFFPDYFKRRAAKKLSIRGIVPKNEEWLEQAKHNKEEMRDIRYLPDEMTFSPEVNFYDDKMLIASWKEKMAIIIESKELVELMKLSYELLWKSLPEA